MMKSVSEHHTPESVFPKWILKYWFAWAAVLILVIAALLRLDRLGVVPSGMTWDEAAIGYNGMAILETRRDEWLTRLPISFKSFGDYKAPLAIYLNGPFTWLFGMNIFSVRLPFALAGVSSILAMMSVTYQLFRLYFPNMSIREVKKLALLAGFFMVTSPWHFHFSRAGFESGLALHFLLWGVFFLMVYFRKLYPTKWIETVFLAMSGISFSLAMYSYHSAKIVAPLLVLTLAIMHWKRLITNWIPVAIATIWSGVILRPMMMDTFWGDGGARFTQTSIFTTGGSVTQQLTLAIQQLLYHLSPSFLLFGQTTTFRHGDGRWGVLLFSEAFLIIVFFVSVIFLLRRKKIVPPFTFSPRFLMVIAAWLMIGLLPAAIGTEIPHSNRALLAYPAFLLMIIAGLEFLFQLISAMKNFTVFAGFQLSADDQQNLVRIVIGMTVLFHVLLFVAYRFDYFTRYAADSSQDFYYGYEKALDFATQYEDEVDKILFTSTYGQPYIFTLFARETNPIWYQGGSLIKYEFTDNISEADLLRSNTVIVATPDQISPSKADEIVKAPSGEVRFVLVKTDRQE